MSKSNPMLAYFFMGQIILFCTALLVGALLLLKRLIKKQPFEGDPAFDNGRIAAEIQQEIMRLRDLRNRLDPSLAAADGGTVTVVQQAAPSGDAVDRAVVEKEVAAKFEKTVHDLEAELKKAREAAATAAAAAPGASAPATIPEGYLSPEQVKVEIEKAATASIDIKKKLDDSAAQISHLEKVLAEYKIFEEDFAMVKKYKAENESLRRQLEALGQAPAAAAPSPEAATAPAPASEPAATVAAPSATSAPTPDVTASNTSTAPTSSDDASRVISGSPAPTTSDKTVFAASPNEASPESQKIAGSTPPPSPTAEATITDQDLAGLFDDLKKKPDAPAEEKTTPPGMENLKQALEEKGPEAAAEGSDENLMAEFEKLLNTPEVKS